MNIKSILATALICVSTGLFAQTTEIGTKFEFNTKAELDAKFVLKDNYNHYLFSVINTDGMLRNNSIILRKFDQKNNLVQTFTQDFAPKDVSFLNNYLGSFEAANGKIVVITESYSKKAGKKDIYKYIFDKTSGSFESSIIASYPIESLMKSGTTFVKGSDNSGFIAVNVVSHSGKSDPEVNDINMLDAGGKLVWHKQCTFDPGYKTAGITVTNSGKAVLLRNAGSYKLSPMLALVSADKKEDKTFEDDIKVQQPRAISIGDKDYLIAFNYPSKGVRSCDYQDLMLYDLENGKMLKNNRISEFNKTENLQEVQIKSVVLQSGEMLIFTEARSEIVVKPGPGVPFSWDKNYKYDKASLFILSFDGELKTVKNLLSPDNQYSNFYHSYGLLNIRGDFYLSNGYYSNNSNSVYALDASKNYERNPAKYLSLYQAFSDIPSQRMVNQLVCYFPDSKRLVVTLIANDKEMSLANVYDLK